MSTTLEDGTLELDRLFNQVERRKMFADKSRDAITGEVGDDISDTIINVYQDAIAATAAVVSGGGLLNGTFVNAPPDEDGSATTIDALENELPSWTLAVVAGSWTVTWQSDANGPDAASVKFAQTTGNASDEAYLEQTIPIAFYRRLVTTIKSSAGNSGMGAKVAVQFLLTDGTTVGSELSATFTGTSLAVNRFWREPPLLATQARIRFGCVNSSGVDNESRTFVFISAEEPTTYSVQIPFVYSFLSPAINSQYTLSYPSDVIPNGVYKSDTQGFVVGIFIKTSATVAGGTATARAENNTQATNPGPTAVLSTGVSAISNTYSLDGASTYHFEVDDELDLEIATNGSYSATAGSDYYGGLRLLLVVNDEGDW
jgi:hypothetical protein